MKSIGHRFHCQVNSRDSSMQGIRRKLAYVGLYEFFGITLTTLGLSPLVSESVETVFSVAVLASVIAVFWNLSFNALFEAWESRQSVKDRNFKRRAVHAILFELTLTAMLVPLIAWLLQVSLLTALLFDIGLIIFFLFYTFFFTLVFDRVFGLPHSSRVDL